MAILDLVLRNGGCCDGIVEDLLDRDVGQVVGLVTETEHRASVNQRGGLSERRGGSRVVRRRNRQRVT